jgi:hypothetical protein
MENRESEKRSTAGRWDGRGSGFFLFPIPYSRFPGGGYFAANRTAPSSRIVSPLM